MKVGNKVKSKRGFTILEVIFALAIIAVVTATGMSIMASAQKSMAKSQKSVLAANDIANITECFKYTVGESADNEVLEFEKAVGFTFGSTFTSEADGVYTLTRDGYVITVTVTITDTERTVHSVASDDGKVVFELTYPQASEEGV